MGVTNSTLKPAAAAPASSDPSPAVAGLTDPFSSVLHARGAPVTGSEGRDLITGGRGADELSGLGGDDWLFGAAGNDRLGGGAGNDRLNGDAGNDALSGGAGDDFLDGGAGFDTAHFSGSVLDYRIETGGNAGVAGNAGLVTTVADLRGGDGTDTLRKIEALQFSDFTLHLDGRNNAPLAVADAYATDEDTPLLLTAADLIGNDWDFEGQPLALAGVQDAVNGSVALAADGSVVFTPAPDFSGSASFGYTVADGHGGSATGTVTLEVNPVADAPQLAVTLRLLDPGAGGFAVLDATPRLNEQEANGGPGSAQAVPRSAFAIASNVLLTDPADPSLALAGLVAPATDTDWYRFEFAAGETVIFDIDRGGPDVDTVITLYSATGLVLAFNDDSGRAHGLVDAGSVSFLDSYLVYTVPAAGEYFLAVNSYAGRSSGDYLLNVSLDDATAQAPAGPAQYALEIAAALSDGDGSEALALTVAGLPAGAALSAGTDQGSGSWSLLPGDLPGLALSMPAGALAPALVVTALATEQANGAVAASVQGGSGDDSISGTAGADLLAGGAGADRFVFTSIGALDTLGDFSAAEGDILDLSQVLHGFIPGASTIGAFVRLDAAPGGTLLSVDADGAGGDFAPLALLQGASGLALDPLYGNGNLFAG